LPAVAKGFAGVESIRKVFEDRKKAEVGEDNHDQHERIQHPSTPSDQVTLALTLLFSLQGIPCVYYGTEQGLAGTVKPDGTPDPNSNESTREALWGKTPVAFDQTHPIY
jgi:glycosidase